MSTVIPWYYAWDRDLGHDRWCPAGPTDYPECSGACTCGEDDEDAFYAELSESLMDLSIGGEG